MLSAISMSKVKDDSFMYVDIFICLTYAVAIRTLIIRSNLLLNYSNPFIMLIIHGRGTGRGCLSRYFLCYLVDVGLNLDGGNISSALGITAHHQDRFGYV